MQDKQEIEIALTDARRSQIHTEATAIFADSVAMGIRVFLQRSAALHNIHAFQTYRSEGLNSWAEYCVSIDLDKSDSYKYLGIARALAASIGITEPESFLFTRQHLDSLFKNTSQSFRQLNLRQLHQLSSRIDIFRDAMHGEELLKLLPERRVTESEAQSEIAERSELAEYNEHMRSVAKANGWRWNTKVTPPKMEHLDGTPLTDEEYARVTPPASAFKPWHDSAKSFLAGITKAKQVVALQGATYVRYAATIRNDTLTAQVNETREQVRRAYEEFDAMLENLCHCDVDRVKEIHRKGLDFGGIEDAG